MSPLCWEIAAALSFLGTHFLLSHPLRAPIVKAVGEAAFLGLYSLVAFATLGWLAFAFHAVPAEAPYWAVGDGLWITGTVLTYFASVLFVGSLLGNPALPNPTGRAAPPPEPRGVFSVTRHPMMWGFALWGVAHILVFPTPANIVLAKTIVVLALVGAFLQDKKKKRLQPETWPAWEAKTSYWPLAAILAGRVKFTPAGVVPILGGIALWLGATWAHQPLAGFGAGIWRWL
ncbi:NnrU family protein [Sphingomonas bacterium]|uniref:NnrU family protein n=1 Tax=Sphingomonas bacterium TaxID=1895847 RepID=UPI00261EBFBF|nr:NnrU family protein [Sphingomonas bacterium]MDB5678166.1 transporter [Sphingomonas bacterium]